jgi:hypothetical protein
MWRCHRRAIATAGIRGFPGRLSLARDLLGSSDMAIGIVDSGTGSGHLAETERRFLTALERLERGTFGLCVECQQPIERIRIDREPLVERCGLCALRPSGQA